MYYITHPQIETLTCNTFAQIFHHLNTRSEKQCFPMLQSTGQLFVVGPTGARYRVGRCGSRLGPAFDDGVSASVHLEFMLREARHYAVDARGNVMKPHEMPLWLWHGLFQIGGSAFGLTGSFSEKQAAGPHHIGDRTCFTLSEACSVLFTQLFGFGHNGPVDRDFGSNGRHEVHVAYALLRDEPVPDATLADYRGMVFDSLHFGDVQCLGPLLQRPYLRGKFDSMTKLSFILMVEKDPQSRMREITVENVGYLSSLLKSLPNDCGYHQLDDALYAHDLLQVKQYQVRVLEESARVPFNEFACAVRRELITMRTKQYQATLDEKIARKQLSQREVKYEQQRINGLELEEGYGYPNKLAAAVQTRNMHQLVSILDNPNNTSSMRAVKRVFGLELERLASKSRIREIFRLAGYFDDAQYQVARAKYDSEVAQARATKLAAERARAEAERLPRTRAAVTSKLFSYKGRTMTAAEFVEELVKDGHVQVRTTSRGATTAYSVWKEDGSSGYRLLSKDGTLAYAKLLIEQVKSTATA